MVKLPVFSIAPPLPSTLLPVKELLNAVEVYEPVFTSVIPEVEPLTVIVPPSLSIAAPLLRVALTPSMLLKLVSVIVVAAPLFLRATAVIGFVVRTPVGRRGLIGAVGVGYFVALVKAALFGAGEFMILVIIVGVFRHDGGVCRSGIKKSGYGQSRFCDF